MQISITAVTSKFQVVTSTFLITGEDTYNIKVLIASVEKEPIEYDKQVDNYGEVEKFIEKYLEVITPLSKFTPVVQHISSVDNN